MLVIISTMIIGVITAYFLYRTIHKFNWILYIIASIVAIFLHLYGNISNLGFVPYGMFMIVGFTGAIPKSTIKKRLAMVRAEYAIIASILIIPHAYGFIELYIKFVFPAFSSTSQLFGNLAFLAMIPLTITSFQVIRRKFTYKQWKKIHQIAYFMYLFVFLHLLLLQNENFWFYLVLFVLYVGFKAPEFYQRFKKLFTQKKEV